MPVGPLSKYAHLAYPSEATERCGGRIKIKKFVSLLSIFPVRDDYRMKMQCAKQCCLPEDH